MQRETLGGKLNIASPLSRELPNYVVNDSARMRSIQQRVVPAHRPKAVALHRQVEEPSDFRCLLALASDNDHFVVPPDARSRREKEEKLMGQWRDGGVR